MKKVLVFAAVLAFAICTAVLAQTSPSAGKNLLADRHIADQGNTCADCHGEGQDNPTGNPAKELCTDCHSWEDLAESTIDVDPNPHDSHMGPGPCEECHHSHKASRLICDQCHSFGLTAP